MRSLIGCVFGHTVSKAPTGKWYIENSLTTLNQPDPVSELNTQLWNTGADADKETARKQKRLSYYSNILVVSDPANPENEGKVFLYRYGQKIFEMIQDVIKPTVPSEDPINPFDPWEGVDFALVARNVAGYRNYDKSKFGSKVRPIADSDEAIDELWAQQYSLNEIVDPSQFKSYDELKAKLEMVLKGSVAAVALLLLKLVMSRMISLSTNLLQLPKFQRILEMTKMQCLTSPDL